MTSCACCPHSCPCWKYTTMPCILLPAMPAQTLPCQYHCSRCTRQDYWDGPAAKLARHILSANTGFCLAAVCCCNRRRHRGCLLVKLGSWFGLGAVTRLGTGCSLQGCQLSSNFLSSCDLLHGSAAQQMTRMNRAQRPMVLQHHNQVVQPDKNGILSNLGIDVWGMVPANV